MREPDGKESPPLPADGPLRPVRGLVLTRNRRGAPFALTDLRKWIRLNADVFKARKMDLLAGADTLPLLADLADFTRRENAVLSLRMQDAALPGLFETAAQAGVLDIFFCPNSPDPAVVSAFMDAAEKAGLPVRMQVSPVPGALPDPDTLAEALKRAASVNVALSDPFIPAPARPLADAAAEWMNRLVHTLDQRGVEANLVGLPFCQVSEENRPHLLNRQQFFLDHQQYNKASYELAEKVFGCGPHRLSKVLENLLARGASLHHAIDRALLPWILDHPRAHVRTWMLHKVTRHFRFLQKTVPLPETVSACEAEVAKLREEQRRTLGPVCAQCRFQRVCDHETPAFRDLLPGLPIRAEEGKPLLAAPRGEQERPRHYDAVDEARRRMPAHLEALAEKARMIVMRDTPTREIPLSAYEIENHYSPLDDASRRWYSFSRGELLSTVLGRLEPPFTLTMTFGGGIAEQIGFSFGRNAKVVCPMIDYSHRLAFHVDAEGHYVLLRDGVHVRPTEFEGAPRTPVVLSGVLEPRISIHNIDGFLLTQSLMLWEGDGRPPEKRPGVKYSVVIVSTRYARRLQAVLLGLANQRDVDFSLLEVVVAHVPGIDGTDDLIESVRQACPHLRIVNSCFSEDHVRSKGFMINESLHVASGEWIVLMDSDIVVPPDIFRRIEEVEKGAHFIAPDGRRMVSPEMTARILLGQVRPWEDYPAAVAATPDYRYREGAGVPCGFFQCVRREVLETLPYEELDHFEASDWIFGRDVINRFGKETRLEGLDVLHLDHGGRQWYGTHKHR